MKTWSYLELLTSIKHLKCAQCSSQNVFFNKLSSYQNKRVTVIELRNENEQSKSSCWEMFFKTGVLKNLVIFTGRHLCWGPFRPATLLKRDSNKAILQRIFQKF